MQDINRSTPTHTDDAQPDVAPPSPEAVIVANEIVAQFGEGTWPKIIDWKAMVECAPGYIKRIATLSGLTVEDLARRGSELVLRPHVSEAQVEKLREQHRMGHLVWGPELV